MSPNRISEACPMPGSKQRFVAVLSVAFAVASSEYAAAADAQRGKQYAQRVCAVCHAVAGKRASPDPNAPQFSAVARSKSFRAKGAALLSEKHPKMPDLVIGNEEAADVAAYIKSLARRK